MRESAIGGETMKQGVTARMVVGLGACLALLGVAGGQMQPAIPKPDERYKADILVVVAHPDDDTAASTYIAKASLDEHKRIAVVFTTRGNSGPNAAGMEQSKALSDVREMEARRALAGRGVTNIWFLRGEDTPTQDVLHSLETLGHGAALEEMVRLVRLTRPEVILTWLPAYVAGENHGDHQASAVLATEAFDLANIPTAFPEQMEAPRARRGTGNYGEGLRPWQPKKIYYYSDGTHTEFLKGRGPVYLAGDTSREKKMTFSRINHMAWEQYATQLDFDDSTVQYFSNQPDVFILGKSLVPASPTGDVWEGATAPVTAASVPWHPETQETGLTLELGGPWKFYKQFYVAHQLTSLMSLVPTQTALGTDRQLWVPLLLENHTSTAQDVTVTSEVPSTWKEYTGPGVYHLEPGDSYPVQVFLIAPPEDSKPKSPQTLAWTATSGGKMIGVIHMAVYLEFDGVGQ